MHTIDGLVDLLKSTAHYYYSVVLLLVGRLALCASLPFARTAISLHKPKAR